MRFISFHFTARWRRETHEMNEMNETHETHETK
jgi:hypothetical protein